MEDTIKNYQLTPHTKFGFLQVTPTPSREEILEFYTRDFYSQSYQKCNDSSLEVQLQDKEFLKGKWGDTLLVIDEILAKPLHELEFLDIGCGWAQALLYFRERGARCYGFDPAPEAVEYARQQGLEVRHSDLENLDVFQGRKFDVVLLNNVLEHLPRPEESLLEIRSKILQKEGLLIVEVPNEFNDFQLAGRNVHKLNDWWVCPPSHLNYFSKDTLTCLLEGMGYSVTRIEASFPLELFLLFDENYVSDPAVGKACHNKRVAFELNLTRQGKRQKLREFYEALAHINLGRQITVYARPK